ncbi:MAG TPA: hypothetical protein VLA23_02330 [Candidatus Limnocylindrales bacterium]|nr:hypothetical protein [Candidatus Limnocylindrales bacterium]
MSQIAIALADGSVAVSGMPTRIAATLTPRRAAVTIDSQLIHRRAIVTLSATPKAGTQVASTA